MAGSGEVSKHRLAGQRDRVTVAARPVGRVRRAIRARAGRVEGALQRSVPAEDIDGSRDPARDDPQLARAVEVAYDRGARALAHEVDRLVVAEGPGLDGHGPVGQVRAAL